MSLLILDARLVRRELTTAWGFRMIGGLDHKMPFTIERVTAEGIAEKAGMEEGDVILKVNDTSLQEAMTHNQACQVILEATFELRLQIQRVRHYDFIPPPQTPQEDIAVQISQQMLVEYMKRIGNS